MKKIFEKNGFSVQKVYSPYNKVSLNYIIKLFPMFKFFKKLLLDSKNLFIKKLLKNSINIKLGNLCLIAKKI